MSECTHNCSTCGESCAERATPQSLRKAPHPESHIGKVFGVVSGKGGVGKSMVTSQLAVTLHRRGYKVGVMDADITGPSIPQAFGVHDKAVGTQTALYPCVSHSGIDGDPEKSDFIRELVSTTNSIDLVFSGHEHRNGVTKIANTDGKEIPVISPGTKAGVVGRALFTYNKATKTYTVEAANAPMTVREGRTTKPLYEPEPELTAALQPYEDATWNVDLVNKVQIWGAYDRTGENTPDDKTDDKPAQLSITAPLTSGNAENLIPKGDIKLGDMFRLYRYENWFYQITMSGKEVRTWLEYSASKVRANEDGTFGIQGGLTYYDGSLRPPHREHDLQRQGRAGHRYLHRRHQQLPLQRRRQLHPVHQRARLQLRPERREPRHLLHPV